MSEWDDIYAGGRQMTRWPWSDLVSAVKRHCGNLNGRAVLELGCGPGANIRFFQDEGAAYHGVEAAVLAGEYAKQFGRVACPVDFTRELNFNGPFDLVCDRAAVTHNDTESIKRCLDMVFEALKPGGYYIGIDWFSTSHYLAHMGKPVDKFTRTEIQMGQFHGVGEVHFSDMTHLLELFNRFEIVSLAHKMVAEKVLQVGMFASWNIVARKP